MAAAKVSLRVWNLAYKLLKLFRLKSYGEAKTLSPLDLYRNSDRNLGKSLYYVHAQDCVPWRVGEQTFLCHGEKVVALC